MTAFVICVGSSLLSKTADVTQTFRQKKNSKSQQRKEKRAQINYNNLKKAEK